MYSLIKPLLFRINPETAHEWVLNGLRFLPACLLPKPKVSPVKLFGLEFPNRIGLAAGLDKNGDYIEGLAKLGFGFIEIGTVTPKPQDGNPKPRLFRLIKDEAIINRMGFNNKGVDYLVERVKKSNYQGILGINIGKNKQTPLESAVDDYLICLRKVYTHASYITVNISSPNTPDLRQLQQRDYLANFVYRLKSEQLLLAERHKRYIPLLIKISPDESPQTLKDIAEILIENEIDGLIATNTTCSRDGLLEEKLSHESGGLSGRILNQQSCHTIATMSHLLKGKVPIIGVGGIFDEKSAKSTLSAGAQLLQVYSGLVYEGPGLVSKISRLS